MSKHGWTYKKLGEVCEFYRGLTYKGTDEVDFSSNVVLRSNNIDLATFTLNFDDLKYITEDILIPEDKLIKKNSLLICMSNGSKQHLGKVAFIDRDYPYAFGGFMGLIKPNGNDIYPKFVYYYCCSPKYKNFLFTIGNGANINNLRFTDIAKNQIPVPGMAEQEAIVAELDEINEAIAALQQQVADLDTLAQSTFYDMFGDPVTNPKAWEVKSLKELSNKISNGNTPKGGSQVYVDDGILFLRSQNVWRNHLVLDDVAYLDELTHAKMADSSLKHNDILITKTGRINTENSSLGRAALFTGADDSANINGHVYLVRLKEGVLHKFILFILISASYRELIRRMCVGGIDKRQLNRNHIEDFPIIFPPISMQQKFVDEFEAIESAKAELNAQITEMQTLLASRMDYYFE